MIVLSILAALLILAAALFVTIFIYLKLRKRFSRNKVLNEAVVITFAVLVSFIVKSVVVATVSDIGGFSEGMAAVWYVIYSTAGGLSFEGIESLTELGVCTALECLYYGSAVYAAITSLSIITVGVSYEFYSYVKVLMFPRTYGALYIFTDTSEESLIMAKSIYAKEKGKKRRRGEKFAVIFMGNELEAFDRKSDVHREIVNYGFYYWSYSKNHNAEREISLLKKLHYGKKKCANKDNGANHNKMVHIFSLKSDENLYAAENLNSNVLFADVAAVLRDYCSTDGGVLNENIPAVINYYVMTQSDVNYEFYNTMANTAVNKVLDKTNLAGDELGDERKKLSGYLQIHILSEAQLYADDLSRQLIAEAAGGDRNAELTDGQIDYYGKLLKDDGGYYRTAVYGFGKAGQHALSELFMATSSFCDGEYKIPSKFIADVYDGNMREISGEFSYNHPLFICKNSYGEPVPETNEDLYNFGKSVDGEAFRAVYNNLNKDILNCKETAQVTAYSLMGYPVIAMHESSCFEMDFMKDADSRIAGIYDKNGVKYRSFVISMGNDESNLLMANMLIDDCRHEVNLKENVKTQSPLVIFVHIRDEKNMPRLNWTDKDRQNMRDSLVVVPFGCRKTIWSYDNIIDDENDSIFNYGYYLCNECKLTDEEKIIKRKLDEYGSLTDKGGERADKLGKEILRDIKSAGTYKDNWLRVDAFYRESNRSVCNFAVNYRKQKPDRTDEQYSRIEHLRWSRFYMANGWIYAKYDPSDETKKYHRHCKEHNCLCPFDMLDQKTKDNDAINVKIARVTRGSRTNNGN